MISARWKIIQKMLRFALRSALFAQPHQQPCAGASPLAFQTQHPNTPGKSSRLLIVVCYSIKTRKNNNNAQLMEHRRKTWTHVNNGKCQRQCVSEHRREEFLMLRHVVAFLLRCTPTLDTLMYERLMYSRQQRSIPRELPARGQVIFIQHQLFPRTHELLFFSHHDIRDALMQPQPAKGLESKWSEAVVRTIGNN